MKQNNDAARDLWAQIFRREAADLNATLHEPDEESEVKQSKMAAQALREAGWSDAEIERRNEKELFHGEIEYANSPGVGPGLEYKLKLVSDRVREVISTFGENSHANVEIAIEPKAGVTASLTNVIMTEQGILSVSSFFFRWCGLVARAYTRTMYANVFYWTSENSNLEADRKFLLKHPDLVLYWFRIFVSFAGTGTHALVPYRPSSPAEFHCFEQVAWAMEYFSVAHEFGHHVLSHRRAFDDPKAQEFQADMFAMKVCEHLEFEPFPSRPNPYTRTGAGASVMFLALEILNEFENLSGSGAVAVNTHPSPSERIDRISKRNLMQPKQLAMDMEFNGVAVRIMSAVRAIMRDSRGAEVVSAIKAKLHATEMDMRNSGEA